MMEREREKWVASDDDDGTVRKQEALLSIKLRKGFASGKRGGPFTPSPTWKLEEDVGEEAESVVGVIERPREAPSKRPSTSARKLGANLWGIQDLLHLEVMTRRSERPQRRRDGEGTDLSHLFEAYQATPYNPAIGSASSLDLKGGMGDARYSLKTSKELLKVLNRIWSLEEKYASNVSVIKSLKVELKHARMRIQELMHEQKEHCCEIDELTKEVAEDKVRKKKEKDRLKTAVQSIREELDDEKKLRRRFESLHHKLGKELNDTKVAIFKASKDLETERKSNGLLQELCDEFARGILRYEKEMGQFKKYAKDCEYKVDDLLLYISEVWLGERLRSQMVVSCGEKPEKLGLKEEIISFLRARKANNISCDIEQQQLQNLRRQSLESLHLNGTISAPHDIEDDDSSASDLHCFELNMDKTKERIHARLKSHGEINASYLESARTSSSIRKVAGIRRTKEALDKQLEGIGLVNIMNSPTDADSSEAAIFQKWTNSNFAGGRERHAGDMDGSNPSIHYTSKNSLTSFSGGKGHNMSYEEENSTNKFSGRGNLFAASSSAQKWNYRGTSIDSEISECSSKLPQGLKENTLKAKLLEARAEGRHARLKALKGT